MAQQTGTTTVAQGVGTNLGTAPGAASIGVFSNAGPLNVNISGVVGGPLILQGGAMGQAAVVLSGSQVVASAVPTTDPQAANPGGSRAGGANPQYSSVSWAIGVLS